MKRSLSTTESLACSKNSRCLLACKAYSKVNDIAHSKVDNMSYSKVDNMTFNKVDSMAFSKV